MWLRPSLLAGLVLAGAVLDWQLWHRPPRPPPAPPEVTIPFIAHDHPAQTVEVEPADYVGQIQRMLADGTYEALETMATGARQPTALFTGGVPQLYRFYAALAWYGGGTDCCCTRPPDSPEIEPVRRHLESWLHADPNSITPRIALAGLWVDYAWDARGCDWGDKVTPEQWEKVGARLSEAEQLLIGPETEADPETFRLLTLIGHLRDWDRERLDAIYENGVRRFPWYLPLYGQHANFIQTKWGGEPGELNEFLASLGQPRLGLQGQLAYSWVAYSVLRDQNADALTALSAYDFEALINAYQRREAQYGLRKKDWNALFLMACKAHDWAAAHTALTEIGDDWASEIWGKRQTFDEWVAWFHQRSRYK